MGVALSDPQLAKATRPHVKSAGHSPACQSAPPSQRRQMTRILNATLGPPARREAPLPHVSESGPRAWALGRRSGRRQAQDGICDTVWELSQLGTGVMRGPCALAASRSPRPLAKIGKNLPWDRHVSHHPGPRGTRGRTQHRLPWPVRTCAPGLGVTESSAPGTGESGSSQDRERGP